MKLTPSAIADIRHRRAGGEKLLTISLDYGVSEMTVSAVVRRPDYGSGRRNRPRATGVLEALRGHPAGRHLREVAAAVYGTSTRSKINRTSVLVHGLKCRGLVRRVGVGVWALTEAA